MFIEPSASTTIARLINSRVTAMIAAVATQLSALIQYSAIQYNAIQYNTMVARRGGGWLCSVEVDSEQVSLESFSEDSERLCGPESGRELVTPLRSQNPEKL